VPSSVKKLEITQESCEPTPTFSVFVELAPGADEGGSQEILEESTYEVNVPTNWQPSDEWNHIRTVHDILGSGPERARLSDEMGRVPHAM
jgi:hypothetical protein